MPDAYVLSGVEYIPLPKQIAEEVLMIVHLCSGPVASKVLNVLTVDCNPASGADIIARIPPLPLELYTHPIYRIDIIHAIEHFRPPDAQQILTQCYWLLQPGGVLVLEQPNIEFCMQVFLGLRPRPDEQFFEQCGLAGIFGDPSHGRDEMQHLWGWTPKTLTELVESCGFERHKISIMEAQYHRKDRDFRLEAVK